jgi:hypothetical protein
MLNACEKSRKLVPLLPDAPAGWNVEGQVTNQDVSGVGYSSMRSYVPAASIPGSSIQRVKVQILVSIKGAKDADLKNMHLVVGPAFWQQTKVNGFDAQETFVIPGESQAVVVYPRSGTLVEIVVYNSKPESDSDGLEKGKSIAQAFADKIDFKQIAALN